ncbi:hypothetical protein BCV72DRAFT_310588 [Rhizopus microsporus var. microsporus]|uniref:Uncharacterized protein n=1 Tax=Rhizopus microsporus var. microsporus TaxID=86635 RepID=A0A1X0QM58_RHIZD|nr:hypothetical protein BCV72DRAFT_310588 [Rhizopus microsporus var. microsporus]
MKRLAEKAAKAHARKAYKVYADDEKTLFLYYLKFKLYKATAAGRMACITVKFAFQNYIGHYKDVLNKQL